MQNGPKWRLFRKLVVNHFNEMRCQQEHLALVEAEATQMMHDIMMAPQELMLHPKRFSNSIIMSLVFGIRTPSVHTSHMLELYDVMEKWSAVMETGATPPVDIFGFLKWVPESLFGNWKKRSRDVNKLMVDLYASMVRRVRKRREAGYRAASLLDDVFDAMTPGKSKGGETLTLNDNEINFLGGVLMEGGSDTSASILLAFIQAMIKYPHVQQRAQAEIDAVLSTDASEMQRSPRWEDYARLPYVAQIVKETMRWRPVTPLGFPHATSTGMYLRTTSRPFL